MDNHNYIDEVDKVEGVNCVFSIDKEKSLTCNLKIE